MGRDKALLQLGERSLLERAIAVLDPLCDECLLACGGIPRYTDLGRRLVMDSQPDVGPLAGLVAGLEAATTEWLAVVACDMPNVTTEVVAALWSLARESELDVCALAGPRGLEPLCAVYRSDLADTARSALERGERRMVSFFGDRCRGDSGPREIVVGTLAVSGAPFDPALNLNTPEDLARAAPITP